MKRKLRIAFTGASGTGKTTLARAIAKHYDLPLEQWPTPEGGFESTTRKVARDMFGRPEPYLADDFRMRAEFQRRLLDTKLLWEKEHAATGYVTDRTHYDNWAYGIMHDIDGSATDNDFVAKVRFGMDRYNRVYYCPTWRIPMSKGDSARRANANYHHVTDRIIYGLLDDGLEFYSVSKRDKDSAVAEVIADIDDCLRWWS